MEVCVLFRLNLHHREKRKGKRGCSGKVKGVREKDEGKSTKVIAVLVSV